MKGEACSKLMLVRDMLQQTPRNVSFLGSKGVSMEPWTPLDLPLPLPALRIYEPLNHHKAEESHIKRIFLPWSIFSLPITLVGLV